MLTQTGKIATGIIAAAVITSALAINQARLEHKINQLSRPTIIVISPAPTASPSASLTPTSAVRYYYPSATKVSPTLKR